MIVKPFIPAHLDELILQPAQAYLQPSFSKKEWGEALMFGDSFTGFAGDKILGCAGLIPMWEGRGLIWALLALDAGQYFVSIHRVVQRYLKSSMLRRIEAHVDVDFPEGQRWIEMLGFEEEGRMRSFTPEGRDSYLYARIR